MQQNPDPQLSPDGRWWWDGTAWQPVQQPQQPPMPTPPPRKSHKARNIMLSVAGGAVLLIVFGAIVGALSAPPAKPAATTAPPASQATTAPAAAAAPAPTAKPPVTPKPAAPAPAPKVLFDLAGTGIKTSSEFQAPSHWTLHYTYDCSNFGNQGNFQVYVYHGSALTGIAVNELAPKGDSTTDVYQGGTLHLEMNSECDWHVTATG